MKKKVKIESVAEYLARGGTITKCEFKKPEVKTQVTRQAPGGPANILSYDEADLFYGKTRQTKKKTKPAADLSALPEALKAKFIAKLNQEIEEDSEVDDDDDEG